MNGPREGTEERLDRLFAAYRDACPEPEASPGFMPRLWERIESRQGWTARLWRWSNGFVAASAAASLFLVMLQMLPARSPDFYTSTYLETLAAAHDDDATVDLALAAVSDTHAQPQESPAK